MLSALDDFARLVPGGLRTTVFCAIIDRALGVVRYSSAGHPPAILAHPDGSTDLLHGAGSVPLASVAVRGRPEAGATVTVRERLRADRLEVLVSDTGGWRETVDPADTERGRGRLIMARLMDEATVDGTAEGTTVRLVKRVTSTG